MADGILDVPPVPAELLEAAAQGRLIVFVGAGVSRLAGSPLWGPFADSLLDDLALRELLSFGDLDQLRSLDPRKKISIAMDIYDAEKLTPDFRGLLRAKITAADVPQIYRDLYSFGTAFVTTNYDEWLDVLAESAVASSASLDLSPEQPTTPLATSQGRIFFGVENLTTEKLAKPGTVLHLHGSVRAPRTMILTTRHYLFHYSDLAVRTFLDELFGKYTVLFIGYGLDEDEILEHVLRKRPASRERRHCRLFPRFGHQQLLTSHLSQYSLKHCSTRLVEYSIDKRGYPQLERVIADWAPQLRAGLRGQPRLEKLRILDDALEETQC